MAVAAGIAARHYISLDNITYNEVLKATDVKPGGQKNDMLDRSYYGQGDAQKRRSKGMHDNQATLKVDYDQADARLTELMNAGDAGSDLWLKTLHDGTHGWSAKGIIESYDVSPPINGKVEVTINWLANGPKTVI